MWYFVLTAGRLFLVGLIPTVQHTVTNLLHLNTRSVATLERVVRTRRWSTRRIRLVTSVPAVLLTVTNLRL